MTQVTSECSNNVAPRRSPGYLMAPFGWAAKLLAAMLEADPSLYAAIFTLSRRRMHLIALALAHLSGEVDLRMARLLVGGAPLAVIDAVLGRRPVGLKRALIRLPVGVLPQARYRQLIELLDEPATAKLIFHLDSIEEKYLGLLHGIPVPLRRLAAGAISDIDVKPEGLGEGLRILAARGAAPSFDALVADLARLSQPDQFIARIGGLVQQLPLPEGLPPSVVAAARRIDDVAEICRLAKRWKNCLADCFLDAVNECRSAVYLWPHPQSPAACVVNRHGRLGWALYDAEGPRNAELPADRLDEIHCAFAAAGIPREAAVEALEHIAHGVSMPRLRMRHRRRNEAAELDMLYDDIETIQTALSG